MDTQFSIKTNLIKAGNAFLVGAIPAAMIVLQDALEKGNVSPKKIGIGLGISVSFAGLKSLQNWLKNRNPGAQDPEK